MEFRTPNEDEDSDFNEAVRAAKPSVDPKEVKHMHACKFGENDGPSWVWILELLDGSFGYLKAWCDYTGWGCQDGGSYSGGFKNAEEAAMAIEISEGEFTEKDRTELLEQINGTRPYALS